jgi:hypothetical protein
MGWLPEMPGQATWAMHVTPPVSVSSVTHQGTMDMHLHLAFLVQP